MEVTEHKAGYINILGLPNTGKSSLVNALVGFNLNVVNKRAQTTRHRIIAIRNEENYQMVFSDTPGLLKPEYALHQFMLAEAKSALDDPDILIFLVNPGPVGFEKWFFDIVPPKNIKAYLVINKTELLEAVEVEKLIKQWEEEIKRLNYDLEVMAISAEKKLGLQRLLDKIRNNLPVHPAFYPKEEDPLSDRNDRFFVTEMIRERMLSIYADEIPYASEPVIESYKEKDDITYISVVIYVERSSQKGIVIGKNGDLIKRLGIEARERIEAFLERKVYLETRVKVLDNWRRDSARLRSLGYNLGDL